MTSEADLRPENEWDAPSPDLVELEHRIEYSFQSIANLRTAVTHSSYANERDDPSCSSNERFEFLGDAVLELVTSEYLLQQYPEGNEGNLSKIRALLVNAPQLTQLARGLGLGDFLLLGRGESMSGGRDKDSLLADAFEALVAAIYLDGGYVNAKAFVLRQLKNVPELDDPLARIHDYKSRLQELCHHRWNMLPSYTLLHTEGPEHDKTFTCLVEIPGEIEGHGSGHSKKAAEQEAARAVLQLLGAL